MSTEKPTVTDYYVFMVNEEYIREALAKGKDAQNVYVLGVTRNSGEVLKFTLNELLTAKGVAPV